MAGEFDYALCHGDCRGTYLKEQTENLFPAASHIWPYMQPNTGHALTLAKNASGGYEVIFQYLDFHGL